MSSWITSCGAAALTLALASCASVTPAPLPAPAPSSPVNFTSAATQTEVSLVSTSDVQDVLSELNLGLSPLTVQAEGCRAIDTSGSELSATGRPVDSDDDGVPNLLKWTLTSCSRDREVLSGSRSLRDPNAESTLAGSFEEQADLTLTRTRRDGTQRQATRAAQTSATLEGRTHLTLRRTSTEQVSDTGVKDRSASWKSDMTFDFTADQGFTIDRRQAAVPGTLNLSGTRVWSVTGAETKTLYLKVSTPTPLHTNPECAADDERLGRLGIDSGVLLTQAYSDEAMTQLVGEASVTFSGCAAQIEGREHEEPKPAPKPGEPEQPK